MTGVAIDQEGDGNEIPDHFQMNSMYNNDLVNVSNPQSSEPRFPQQNGWPITHTREQLIQESGRYFQILETYLRS